MKYLTNDYIYYLCLNWTEVQPYKINRSSGTLRKGRGINKIIIPPEF